MLPSVTVTARKAWTDERLDDLSARMEKRFDEVDRRFDQVDKRFEQVDKRFEKVEGEIQELRRETKAGFDLLHARMDSMQRTLIVCFSSLGASLIVAVVAAVLASSP
jgi:tetrahydromethanopterin S-methyltransferase subunit G